MDARCFMKCFLEIKPKKEALLLAVVRSPSCFLMPQIVVCNEACVHLLSTCKSAAVHVPVEM